MNKLNMWQDSVYSLADVFKEVVVDLRKRFHLFAQLLGALDHIGTCLLLRSTDNTPYKPFAKQNSYHFCVLGKNLSTGQKLSVLGEWDDWLREFPYVQFQQ